MTAHHSFLLTEHLSTLEYLDEAIARVSGEIDQRLTAEQEAIGRHCQVIAKNYTNVQ